MASSAAAAAGGRPAWNDPTAQPYIRIEGVTKRFGDFVAVDDVSLNIFRSELFCLLGGSGCGKTTLLRMLAGFEQPSRGKIFIDGLDMSGIPPYERPVNMMFQSYALFPHMSVEQNIGFGLKMEHRPRSEIAERVAQMLALVRLEGFGKRRPEQLSGGQRQRVALARALIKQPKLRFPDLGGNRVGTSDKSEGHSCPGFRMRKILQGEFLEERGDSAIMSWAGHPVNFDGQGVG